MPGINAEKLGSDAGAARLHSAAECVTSSANRKTIVVGGLPFDVLTLDDTVARICAAVKSHTPLFLSTPNLSFVMAARSCSEFRQSILSSDLSVADGIPILWLARRQGTPLPERVAGADVFDALRFGAAREQLGRPLRVFFFGGPEGVAHQACRVLNREEPVTHCMQGVGAIYPGHGSVDDMSSQAWIDDINASGADFLVVALGARKGQAWIMANRHRLKVPVVSHLGAVVNFVAGTVSRAPRPLRRVGLEWLWRIKEEPELFNRYWEDGKGLIQLWWHAKRGL